jgi:hypothetical protein
MLCSPCPDRSPDIAYQNKTVVYDLLLKVAAETLISIAGDPRHLGGRIGLTAVLHTWGSALTHHPHAHIIVPGGGVSLKPAPAQAGGQHWIVCRPGFFLSVRVLSSLFRRLFLEALTAAYQAGRLEFFADQAVLAESTAFQARLAALRRSSGWSVPSGLLADPRCPRLPVALRTGFLLPTAGSSPSTASAWCSNGRITVPRTTLATSS